MWVGARCLWGRSYSDVPLLQDTGTGLGAEPLGISEPAASDLSKVEEQEEKEKEEGDQGDEEEEREEAK